MQFTDVATLKRRRQGSAIDALRQPIKVEQAAEQIYCRAWPNREGHRESVEALTDESGTIRIEGFSIGVPGDIDVAEGDIISSLQVDGRQWLSGTPLISIRVRGIIQHRRYAELQCQIIR